MARVRKPATREERRKDLGILLGAGLALTCGLGAMVAYGHWYVDRFTHHSETVDARLVDRVSLKCLGAMGMGGLVGSGANVWKVEFPTANGLHTTKLVHPCDVLPPDFGRGRGYMWMQYDVDNPDLTRVLNDTKGEDALRWQWAAFLAACGLECVGVVRLRQM